MATPLGLNVSEAKKINKTPQPDISDFGSEAEDDMIEELMPITEMPLPEAGAIAFTYVISPEGARISLTTRAWTGREVLDRLMEAINYGAVKYGLKPESFQLPPKSELVSPPSVAAPSAKAAKEAILVAASSPAPAATSTSSATTGDIKTTNPYPAVKMEVVIDAKGTYLKFNAVGRDFPDFSAFRKNPENLLPLLKDTGDAWTLETLAKPAIYNVKYLVHWEYSTTAFDRNNNPYKNVTKIVKA